MLARNRAVNIINDWNFVVKYEILGITVKSEVSSINHLEIKFTIWEFSMNCICWAYENEEK